MNNDQKINLEIQKQVAAGFSGTEIRSNLLGLQFSADEIERAMSQNRVSATADTEAGKFGWVSLIVSILIIFSGLMKMSKYPSGSGMYTWGIIMLLGGIAGACWKLADIVRK